MIRGAVRAFPPRVLEGGEGILVDHDTRAYQTRAAKGVH